VSELDAASDIVLRLSQLNLSARAYHRILKLSHTIADLAGSEEIQSAHPAETLQYPPKIMIENYTQRKAVTKTLKSMLEDFCYGLIIESPSSSRPCTQTKFQFGK
jgi:magnesium chelatase subunit ChlI-like protein